ncbi:hypothetical protein BGX38DRAFT_1280323 [Terfezia claveryi]|nr:hypothetical protein BGX38DRAFT_1280323 [Terfezia claveryi]
MRQTTKRYTSSLLLLQEPHLYPLSAPFLTSSLRIQSSHPPPTKLITKSFVPNVVKWATKLSNATTKILLLIFVKNVGLWDTLRRIAPKVVNFLFPDICNDFINGGMRNLVVAQAPPPRGLRRHANVRMLSAAMPSSKRPHQGYVSEWLASGGATVYVVRYDAFLPASAPGLCVWTVDVW